MFSPQPLHRITKPRVGGGPWNNEMSIGEQKAKVFHICNTIVSVAVFN